MLMLLALMHPVESGVWSLGDGGKFVVVAWFFRWMAMASEAIMA